MKRCAPGILLLALAVAAGCRGSGSAPEQSPVKAAPKINISFDLTEYRELANEAQEMVVGTIRGTRLMKMPRPRGEIPVVEVRPRASDNENGVRLFEAPKVVIAELDKHVGEDYLFFLRLAGGGPGRVIRAFPLDEKHTQVLSWLQGGAKQYTLFKPGSKNELPRELEASNHIVIERNSRWLMVRFTNRSKKPIVLAASTAVFGSFGEYCSPYTTTRVVGEDGRVVWPGVWCVIGGTQGEDYMQDQYHNYVTLAPGESLDVRACEFAIMGQQSEMGGVGVQWLPAGKCHFRFTYDSRGCKTYEGQAPIKTLMVVYGSFEARP